MPDAKDANGRMTFRNTKHPNVTGDAGKAVLRQKNDCQATLLFREHPSLTGRMMTRAELTSRPAPKMEISLSCRGEADSFMGR